MTNTLHRYGDADSFQDDYVVFAMCCRGQNDEGVVPKLRKFLEMALPYQAGESGRPTSRRRAALVESDEPCVALEAGHDSRTFRW